jgi:hypothetical protein
VLVGRLDPSKSRKLLKMGKKTENLWLGQERSAEGFEAKNALKNEIFPVVFFPREVWDKKH